MLCLAMRVKVFVLTKGQDDPDKCTAERLIRRGIARRIVRVKEIPSGAIVLNPFAKRVLTPLDRDAASRAGIVAIDVSWKAGVEYLKKVRRGFQRVLPILIAANPINYGKPFKLSTAEALMAALYIMGFRDDALRIAKEFKWGPVFLDLNRDLLDEYSQARSENEVLEVICVKFGIEKCESAAILYALRRSVDLE